MEGRIVETGSGREVRKGIGMKGRVRKGRREMLRVA